METTKVLQWLYEEVSRHRTSYNF